MQMQLYILYLLGLFGILLCLFLLAIFSNCNERQRQLKVQDASLTFDELEAYAKEIAIEHSVSGKKSMFSWPIPRMNDNYRYIMSVYKEMNEDVQKGISTTPAAEWLLDNFYIIEEQVKSLRRTLQRRSMQNFPCLTADTLKAMHGYIPLPWNCFPIPTAGLMKSAG